MNKIVEITAILEREKFRKDDFLIADARLVDSSDHDDPRTFALKGNAAEGDIQYGVEYRYYGSWDRTSPGAKKYGPSFAFKTFVVTRPISPRGIIAYMIEAGKGLGIGPATAKQLYEKFRGQTLDVCRDQPEVATAAIPRATPETMSRFAERLRDFAHIESAWIEVKELLDGRGFPKTLAKKVLQRWGNKAPAIISRDPYKLMSFRGVGFLKCDSFYKDLGLNSAALKRQAYCVAYEVASSTEGSTWIPVSKAISRLKASVSGSHLEPEKAITLARRGKIIAVREDSRGNQWIAYARDAAAEEAVATRIAISASEQAEWPVIPWSNDEDGLPTSHQFEELSKATAGTIGLFCGSPGSGKSFSLSFLLQEIIRLHGTASVAVAAPTGKAACRVNEFLEKMRIPLRATTIHSMLGVEVSGGEGWKFLHDEYNPLPYRYIVLDEFSMCDVSLMSSILRARARGTHILLVGDKHQLPPVGRGAPLRDFITAGLPYGELTKIHRNAGTIVRACHAIKDNLPFPTDTELAPDETPPRNLKFIHATKGTARTKLFELIEALREDESIDAAWDAQVLVAVNKKSPLSREKLNAELQPILNPAGQGPKDSPFRTSDKIICLKNSFFPSHDDDGDDTKIWIANGEIGKVIEAHDNKTIVRFENPTRTVLVPRGKQAKTEDSGSDDDGGAGCDLSLAYAVTTHKYQGSSVPIAIVIVDEHPGATGSVGICDRNWLYTAISRAEKVCYIIGNMGTCRGLCKRVYIDRRKTFLAEDIRTNLQEMDLRFPLFQDPLFDPAGFADPCYEPIS